MSRGRSTFSVVDTFIVIWTEGDPSITVELATALDVETDSWGWAIDT